jgi:hypothetical protein
MWLIQLFLFQKNGETNTEKSQNFHSKKILEKKKKKSPSRKTLASQKNWLVPILNSWLKFP